MTSDTSAIEQKVIAAFKGFIRSYRLEPMQFDRDRLEPEYREAGRTFSNENGEHFELYYHVRSCSIVLELLRKLFPDQVDNKLVTRMLLNITADWITEGKDPSAQDQLEQAGQDFISKLKEAIRPLLLFLPIEGLEVLSSESITVGNCELFSNHKGSQLMQVMEQDRKRYHRKTEENDSPEKIKSYFTTNREVI